MEVNGKAILQDINLEADHIELEEQVINLWEDIAMKHRTYGNHMNNRWRNLPEYEEGDICLKNSKERFEIYKFFRDGGNIVGFPRRNKELLEVMKKVRVNSYEPSDIISEASMVFKKLKNREKNWKSIHNQMDKIISLWGDTTRYQSKLYEEFYIYPKDYWPGAWSLESILYAKKVLWDNGR